MDNSTWLNNIAPLDPSRYLESHDEAYYQYTNQPQRILSWLTTQLHAHYQQYAQHLKAPKPFRILSIGCGSGRMDAPLIDALPHHTVAPVDFTGIDPNKPAHLTCRQRVKDALPLNAQVSTATTTLEAFSAEQPFDCIMAVTASHML